MMLCVICGKDVDERVEDVVKEKGYKMAGTCYACNGMTIGEARIVQQLRRLADAIEEASKNGVKVKVIDLSDLYQPSLKDMTVGK